ncbi:unnamed protein product, partial [Mesorhabditis belari]|uniref:Probable RNA-binding protein EIF1AD n=1 Tax=Mesorhabditis belari TaxID=2138241 RepID=A0AAF3ELE9_9BILA
MSVATKRRFMQNKVDSEYFEPKEGDRIAMVRSSRGNNLHEVEDEFGNIYLASMPLKFRKSVWVMRNQFVVLQPIEEGDKVKAEIDHILDEENVLHLREKKIWPERFEAQAIQMTRNAKKGVEEKTESNWIDDDMLPSSGEDSDEEEDTESESEHEQKDDNASKSGTFEHYNPNRKNVPGHL